MAEDSIPSEDYLLSLQRRVEALEQRLVGEERVREGQPTLIHLLSTIERKLRVLGEPDPVSSTWREIGSLEKLVDPEYLKSKRLAEGSKELLFGYVDRLSQHQEQVEELKILRSYLNSKAFQDMDQIDKKLSPIALAHIKQEGEVDTLTSQTQMFLDTYSKLLLQLSDQCIQWDNTVSQLERARK